MAPLLRTYFNPRHRSFLSTLFASTFLTACLVVAFPCPVRAGAGDGGERGYRPGAALMEGQEGGKREKNSTRQEIVVMMNQRGIGKRRFLGED